MKRLICTFIMLLLIFCSSVCAEISCEVSLEGDDVVIKGQTTRDEPYADIGIFVPVYGERFSENITVDEIIAKTLYAMQKNADAEGKFTFILNMSGNPLGRYSFVISDGVDKLSSDFMYASGTEKIRILKKINEAETGTAISELIDISSPDADGSLAFNLSDEVIFVTDSVKVLEYFASLNSVDKIVPENLDEFVNKLTAAGVMSALDEGICVDFNKYAELLFIDEAYMTTYVEKLSEEETKELADAFKGKGINTYEGFGTQFKEAVILTVLNNISSWADADYIIRNHGGDIGINTSAYKSFSKYRQLSAQLGEKSPYGDIEGFVSEYKRIYNKLADSGNSGGSGGSSGGGGGGNKSNTAEFSGEINDAPVSSESFNEPAANTFTDLSEAPWAAEYIIELSRKGIINGTGNGRFLPSGEIKREEFVKMLTGAFNLENKGGSVSFADTDSNAWYYEYVVTAYSNGIIKGYENNTFGIGKSLSRQELVTLAYRAAELKGIKLDAENKSVFSDADKISAYAVEAVNAFKNAGIINGMGNNLFDPGGTVTRAQASKIICLLMEYGGAL